jgi:hypothetical protein
MVKARVKLVTGENAAELRMRIYALCLDKLAKFKIPERVVPVNEMAYGERFKTRGCGGHARIRGGFSGTSPVGSNGT